ncbi:hypothetical protein ACFV0Y_36985, partial [Streptomyces sp. NPDC059569]
MRQEFPLPVPYRGANVRKVLIAGRGESAARVTRAAETRQVNRVVIRFAGDSGDGMQLTGDRFTSETASFGNDLSTLPNFPA